MAKRFIDSNIFRKGYMRAIPSNVKLFYIYLFCECDHYGIWSVELDVAEVRLGITLDYKQTKDLLKDKIVELDGGRKWFLPQFITFQYGTLSSKHKLHNSVAKELNRLGLMQFVTLALQLANSDGTQKEMEMEMEKDMEMEKEMDKASEPASRLKNKDEKEPLQVGLPDGWGKATAKGQSRLKTTAITESKQPRKRKGKAASTADELKQFIDAYHTWSKDKGIMFRFTSADGAAMKQIIKHLNGIESVQSGSKSSLDVWRFILTNWNTLNAWMQTQVQVRQINSQLPNIIEQIRQHYGQSKQVGKANSVADFAKSLRNAIKGS